MGLFLTFSLLLMPYIEFICVPNMLCCFKEPFDLYVTIIVLNCKIMKQRGYIIAIGIYYFSLVSR